MEKQNNTTIKHLNQNKMEEHKTINEQVAILQDTLNEMMTGFDSEEDKIDFILDICNGYRKRISEPKSE